MDEGMLAGEGKSSRAHTAFLKDLAMMVESLESVVKGVQCVLCEDVFLCDITKIQECCDSLDDPDGGETFKCGYENRFGLSTQTRSHFEALTFMKAFESLPVHCWKFRPCLNL